MLALAGSRIVSPALPGSIWLLLALAAIANRAIVGLGDRVFVVTSVTTRMFFIAKNILEYFRDIALKNLELHNQTCHMIQIARIRYGFGPFLRWYGHIKFWYGLEANYGKYIFALFLDVYRKKDSFVVDATWFFCKILNEIRIISTFCVGYIGMIQIDTDFPWKSTDMPHKIVACLHNLNRCMSPIMRAQASKFVKIHGSKLLLPSLRAGSKTIFVVANLWGFERPRPIHGSYWGSVCPQVCYNVINIMIYGGCGCILFGWLTYGLIASSL